MKLGEYVGSPCIEVPEEDWRKIEATLGLEEPNNEVRKSIALYVSKHLLSAELDFPKQRASSQKKWIGRIRNKTQDLINVLDWEASEDEGEDGYAQMYAVYDLLEKDRQENLLALLKELLAKADDMLLRVPKGKAGPDADSFSWGLVLDLAFLYQWATNKPPTITYNPLPDINHGEEDDAGRYESRFLDFVAAVFAVFAPDRAKGNIALGKHIERVLKVWRRCTRQKDKTSG
jgi:hypothetical protein